MTSTAVLEDEMCGNWHVGCSNLILLEMAE